MDSYLPAASYPIIVAFAMWAHPALALLPPVPKVAITVPEIPKDPIWEKPSALQKLPDRGWVIVSTRLDKPTFTVIGLAETRGASGDVFQKATEWNKIKNFSMFFKQAEFYPAESQIAIDLAILGFRPSILVQIEQPPGEKKQIHWKVLRGPFAGLAGAMIFEPTTQNSQRTWVKSWGSYTPEKEPWSDALTSWALEGCLERIGNSLKLYVER